MTTSKPLIVRSIYLYEIENAVRHHTDLYELVLDEVEPSTVLRRGQPFVMAVYFDRPYSDATDTVRLIFNFGDIPNTMNGTKAVITVTNNPYHSDPTTWGVRKLTPETDELRIEVSSSVDSPVGIWQLEIKTVSKSYDVAPNIYPINRLIYLLFNPWIEADPVYMKDPAEVLLEEYVSNDTGKIWVGKWRNPQGNPWFFGQFSACVLPACDSLLNLSGIKSTDRGDPVKMSRAIARIVNSHNGQGVLIGQWGNSDYSAGTHPSQWHGSVPILKQFLETGRAVKFAQCWVFAGVVTTVCRALGIPSRVVTNFVSVHDVDDSLSADLYFTRNGLQLESLGDSVWNFHVWNDVWMSRPDLPKGHDGWQAIDATPQEKSDGMFRCGPTSHLAIREGAIGYNYDVQFMLASVNSDVIHWIEDEESEFGWAKLRSLTKEVGRLIVTQKPLSLSDPDRVLDREDITALYKYEEGSQSERETLFGAAVKSKRAMKFYYFQNHDKGSVPGRRRHIAVEDVEFDLVDLDEVEIGKNFTATLHVKNNSDEPRTIDAILSIGSVFYNGVDSHLVKRRSNVFTVPPHGVEPFQLTVTVDDYVDKLVDHEMMKSRAIATVQETKQIWANEHNFQILKPTVNFEFEDRLKVFNSATVGVSFKNPLNKTLTKCQLEYVSPGLAVDNVFPVEDVGPNEFLHGELELIPPKVGYHWIVAKFTSKQLSEVRGSARIMVRDNE